MTNGTIDRACFICGSRDGETVFRTAIDVCGLGHVTFAMRCCSGCGMTLQDPAVSPETMMRQYATFSNYTAFGDSEPPLNPTARRMMELIRIEGIAPGRMYDVGAATGSMLWHFRKQGWAVAGCDLSPKAVEQAQGRNGIDMDLGSGEEMLPHRGNQDLVTFSHVLEHVYDPTETLKLVHAALAPGGLLMFEVPCLAAPEINPPGFFMMEHVNYFDEVTAGNLLRRIGFDVLQAPIDTSLEYYSYPVITVLARKQEPQPEATIVNGFEKNTAFCRAYAAIDQKRWDAADARLHAVLAPEESVYVWGAGLHTSTLLERTSLTRRTRVAAITDRDPQKHGHTLGPHRVIPPAEVLADSRKIVISSYHSEGDIADGLIRGGVPAERIVRPHGRGLSV
jgi:SAM-dependent methyltransferase